MAWNTPRTWSTSEVVTASMLNTNVRDNANALRSNAIAGGIFGAWAVGSGFTFNTDAQEYVTATPTSQFGDRIKFDTTELSANGTPQMRVVQQVQVSAANSATSLTLRLQAYVEAASGNTGAVNTNIGLVTGAAITGSPVSTGFKSVDSGWVSFASLVTNISAYGFTILRPRYRLDFVTGAGPTLFHLSALVMIRVA